MKFESKGYKYRGIELGQKVFYEGNESVIIGFCEDESIKRYIAIYNENCTNPKIQYSNYITTALYSYEDCKNWKWVSEDDIEIKNNIENVLEIKVTELNKQYSAVEITYQNMDVLERGNFSDNKIKVVSSVAPIYSKFSDTFYIKGNDKEKDNKPFIIENKYIKEIKARVRLINEKYGIPKRWRAERNCAYYFISDSMNIICSEEIYNSICDVRYTKGNYFKTEEDAMEKLEKIKNILVGDK